VDSFRTPLLGTSGFVSTSPMTSTLNRRYHFWRLILLCTLHSPICSSYVTSWLQLYQPFTLWVGFTKAFEATEYSFLSRETRVRVELRFHPLADPLSLASNNRVQQQRKHLDFTMTSRRTIFIVIQRGKENHRPHSRRFTISTLLRLFS
jgi:hypothetical protein